ncbi:hypothetical protein ANCCAN_05424 [Ancylostoma caninum]|uniref:SCP domain-containing protein n=1 Tax=Ancylostoma caninum TaxID=29170 RepID=A0A368GYJ1_ANCCA|nr:hypothetical protein ANCCAN_05424 [Ancylostoma caninum]
MIASYLVAFGVSLVASAPTQSPDLLCPNSTFDKDIIEEYVIRSINDARYKILSGLQLNGPWQGRDEWSSETQGYGKKLPLGKTMNLVEYDCQLEQEAKAALNPNCTYDIPNAPVGKTGIFYNKDIDWDVPEIGSAVAEWLEEIDEFAVSDHAISDTNVTFQDNTLREYLSVSLDLPSPKLDVLKCSASTTV